MEASVLMTISLVFIYISFSHLRKERAISLVYFDYGKKGSFLDIEPKKKEEKKNRVQGGMLMNCLTGNCSGTLCACDPLNNCLQIILIMFSFDSGRIIIINWGCHSSNHQHHETTRTPIINTQWDTNDPDITEWFPLPISSATSPLSFFWITFCKKISIKTTFYCQLGYAQNVIPQIFLSKPSFFSPSTFSIQSLGNPTHNTEGALGRPIFDSVKFTHNFHYIATWSIQPPTYNYVPVIRFENYNE